MSRLLLIDNYDSFTHNLAHRLQQAGADVTVVRNDAMTRADVDQFAPDAIALSPGPGHPKNAVDFGVCRDLIDQPLEAPMLGICLGMQGMALHTGLEVTRAPEIIHGEADRFHPSRHPIFSGVSESLEVGRYHSLAVNPASLSSDWQNLGQTRDGTLMAMAHTKRPWVGLQFHPESILTPDGPKILRNFIEMCK